MAPPARESAIATSLNAVLRRAAGGGGPSSTAFAVAFALAAGAAFLGTLGAAGVRPRET